MPGTDQRISLLTTSEHDYKVLPQLRIPMVRTELLIFPSVVCLQFSLPWIISVGLLAYPALWQVTGWEKPSNCNPDQAFLGLLTS